MVVEVLFWFHPLVWWVGARMITERERACDEAVIESGNNRQIYAEGILKVCQHYVEPPLPCAAGVSGGTLRKRIEDIMTKPGRVQLSFAGKSLLGLMGLATIAGPCAIGFANGTNQGAPLQNLTAGANAIDMQHYQNSEWKFALDIPRTWNVFPAVPTNSPFEVIRFAAHENKSTNLLIVFRNPHDPQAGIKEDMDRVQQILTKAGFSNFVAGEAMIGSKRVATLDFDRPMPDGGVWSCRQYFITDGTLVYVLGFGTTRRDAMFDLFDRVAKTFVSERSSG
jgi:hypothetical protein